MKISTKNWLLFLSSGLFLLAAGILHYLYIFHIHPVETMMVSDSADYLGRAEQVVTSGLKSFDTAWKPKGYYLMISLSMMLSKWGVFQSKFDFLKWLHWSLSLVTPFLMAKLVRPYLGAIGFVLTLAVGLFYFPLFSYGGFFMAETVFAALFTLFIYVFHKFGLNFTVKQGVVLGLLFLCTYWVKGQGIIVVPFLFLFAWVNYRKLKGSDWRTYFNRWSAFLLTFVTTVFIFNLPFRNEKKPEGLLSGTVPTVAAVNFAASKCNQCCSLVDRDGSWVLNPYLAHFGCNGKKDCHFARPFSDSKYFYMAGVKCVIDDPTNLFYGMRNFFNLFVGNEAWPIKQAPVLLPALRNGQYIFEIFFLPGVLFLIVTSFFRRKTSRLSILVAVPVALIFCSLFLLDTEIRFRIPFDGVLIVAGILGFISSMNRYFKKGMSRVIISAMLLFVSVPWSIYLLTESVHESLAVGLIWISVTGACSLLFIVLLKDFFRSQSALPNTKNT